MVVKDILPVIHGKVVNGGNIKKPFKHFCVDTRKMQKGDVFIALVGEYVDGHQFIKEAIQKKARGIIVSKEIEVSCNIPIILVEDTKETLLILAEYIRNQYIDVPLVAITGSVGKTTTKELIASILSCSYQVVKNEGSYNNHIGLPLTMFEVGPETEMIVQEIGMNHVGEIDKLSRICKPNVGVITCIGSAHIGYLKSKKNIFSSKMEIVNGMDSGCLILNGDDRYLKKVHSKKQEVIFCGCGKKCDLKAYSVNSKIQSLSFKIFLDKEYEIFVPIPGYLLPDVLLAIRVGLLYDVPITSIMQVLENFSMPFNRANVMFLENGTHLIADCYNASYESVISILKEMKQLDGEKVCILGDILELGDKSYKIHKEIGKYIRGMKNVTCYFIGENMKVASKMVSKSFWFRDVSDFLENVSLESLVEKTVLVKGSHRLCLDKVVDAIYQYQK